MTVETDLAKRVGELNLEKRVDGMEKMDKKLSTDSMNGESLEKRVRQLRGPIVIGRAQHGIVKWFSVAKGLFLEIGLDPCTYLLYPGPTLTGPDQWVRELVQSISNYTIDLLTTTCVWF